MTSKFSPKTIQQLDDNLEREHATIDIFNQAMEDNDADTAREVCEFVINDDETRNSGYSRGWQFHCLKWLTAHYIVRWQSSPDDSEEETIALDGLMESLWKHKWLIGSLPCDASLSQDDIKEATDSMSTLYKDFELSQAMVYKARLEQNIYMGNVADAKKNFAKWQSEEKDNMNDCDACEQNTLIAYYNFIGDHKKVEQLAKPILSGKLTCSEVPHTTYPPVINSMIQLGKLDEAQEILNDAIELIRESSEHFLWLMSLMIQFAMRLNHQDLALELLDEFSNNIVKSIKNNHFEYLQYLIAVAPFNDEALIAARGLAKNFDDRNGNRHYQNQLDFLFTPPTLH